MTRKAAFKLACEVADAGFSTQMAISLTPGRVQANYGSLAGELSQEICSVHICGIRFESKNLRKLVDIADAHDLELHLIGSDFRFMEVAPGAKIR